MKNNQKKSKKNQKNLLVAGLTWRNIQKQKQDQKCLHNLVYWLSGGVIRE